MYHVLKKYAAIVSSIVIVSGSMLTNTVSFAASADTTVIITKTGECYHKSSCSTLKKTRIETTMQAAVDKGLRPCKVCKPGSIDSTSATSSAKSTTTTATATTTAKTTDPVEALKYYKGNSKEFNAYTYYINYADLQTAVGADGDKLLKHFNEHGKAEGRKAS
ncbi:MAG: hypothetical protein K6E91_07905 [Butyrivibrio sp.]|nr:hypothetical protein [Butyrivibrio sp.]